MNAFEKELVDALRSDRFIQGTGQLRSSKYNKYCCLGVACTISGCGEWTSEGEIYRDNDNGFDFISESFVRLTDKVRIKLNWAADYGPTNIIDRAGDKVSLIRMNDDGFTFSQIADVIANDMIIHIGENYICEEI